MTIAFTKVALPNGYLGNMSPHPIVYKDVLYYTAEHLFQALRFKEESIVKEIISVKSPMAAKMIAKKYSEKMVIIPRSIEDLKNMIQVLCLKFLQNEKLKEDLIATGTELLIENSTNRPNESGLFWGAANISGSWKGKNVLGKLLMTVRSHYQLR